jgi:hypothetical protein
MNEIYENEKFLPPPFMATTRQKILLKNNQVQEYAVDYLTTSPILNIFLTVGNAAVNLFTKK